MATTERTTPPRAAGTRRRALLACGLVGLLLLVAVLSTLVRPDRATSLADLDRIEDAVQSGCDRPAADLVEGTGFALDGVVTSVVPGRDRGPLTLSLDVQEWFMGPPLDRVEVLLDHRTARSLATGGTAVVVGSRLLVSGRGWGTGQDLPVASGCGRTRAYERASADDWRGALPTPDPVAAEGPAARYVAAGFVRTAPGGLPGLSGVLLLDGDCLYVHDGLTRWVPVFPAEATSWTDGPPQLQVGAETLDVGQPVRLGGAPASGLVQRGARRLEGDETRSRRVDEAGVPEACDPTAPRFIVGEPAVGREPRVDPLAESDRLLLAAERAARGAGLDTRSRRGESRRDPFGEYSLTFVLTTGDGDEVRAHVDTVAFLAWPFAFAPADAGFLWSVHPDQRSRLPEPPRGGQIAVVEHADGRTQLLLRTPERVVVSVTADLAAGPRSWPQGDEALQALADVATALTTDAGTDPEVSPAAAGS